MRIVAGTAGGRTLLTPPGNDVRPTKDRVREAIFNSLHSHGDVEGRYFLDLFAGSGALGLEALSRGAAGCTFIDNDRQSIALVADNVQRLGFGDTAVVRQGDAARIVTTLGAHHVALLDPPYSFDGWLDLLRVVRAEVVVMESNRQIEPGPGWRILKDKRYAGTVVTIARRNQEPPTQEGAEDARP
ncbi:MAG: 16S rRNA (guanine(966)-N(2))-methyltransferase RsmD [Acidimicrobiales bacterium]